METERSKCNNVNRNVTDINCDDGNLVKTNTWTTLLRNINNLERTSRNQRCHFLEPDTYSIWLGVNTPSRELCIWRKVRIAACLIL